MTRRSGARTSRCSTTATCAPWTGAHALRRQRGRCRTRRPRPTRARSSRTRSSKRTRGLKAMWPGYAFSEDFREERGHAYMLEDQTFTKRQEVVKQPGACIELPRVDVRALQEGGQRRHHQGLREDQPDALRRGAQAGEPSGRLHRLPRSEHDAAARHAARRSSKASARSRRRRA